MAGPCGRDGPLRDRTATAAAPSPHGDAPALGGTWLSAGALLRLPERHTPGLGPWNLKLSLWAGGSVEAACVKNV